MLLNCQQLQHWKLSNFVTQMHEGSLDYDNLINLKIEQKNITFLENKWNEYDAIKKDTILLHTTEKITQPWRVGLKLNSAIKPLFGIFPRAPIYRLFGKNLTIGREHPEKIVTSFFMKELANCLKNRIIGSDEIDRSIENNFLRSDIYQELEKYQS